jgi:hypothetical protein
MVNGIVTKYANAIPEMNRDMVGKSTLMVALLLVCFLNAGEIKPYDSLTIIGIDPIKPIKTET